MATALWPQPYGWCHRRFSLGLVGYGHESWCDDHSLYLHSGSLTDHRCLLLSPLRKNLRGCVVGDSMNDVVIRTEGLSKQYYIGGKQEPYRTLRDTVAGAFAAPFRRASKLL